MLFRTLCAAAALLFTVAGTTPIRADEVEFGAAYVQDFLYDVEGGLDQGGSAPGIIDLTGDITWSHNDLIHMDLLATFGGSISDHAGDLQTLSSIEAYNTFKAFAAWYQHDFTAANLMLRVGLQDYNALFNAVEPAGLFVNSSFGLDPTIAQAGVSTFPVTAVGGVLRWESDTGLYVMGGLYDGVAGSPGHPDGTHIEFASGDGAFSALEIGLTGGADESYKVAAGGWYRTTNYVDPAGRPRGDNAGAYLIGSMQLVRNPGISAFLQIGHARPSRNPLERYIGAGVTISGLIPNRPVDTLGLGMARAVVSDAYGSSAARAETALELTYQLNFGNGLLVQPDIQYIIDPSASRQIDNAWVAGVRVVYVLP